MRNALRIGGWSHSFGHIMEALCRSFPQWPEYLFTLRIFCRIFKVAAYRKHIIAVLATKLPALDLGKLLKEFTASFAKWRFETLFQVLAQLKPLRELCEQHMERGIFNSVQEETDFTEFIKGCKMAHLWRWIVHVYSQIIKPLEKLRRWGLVCSCHGHLNRVGRKLIKCWRNGRRLREARKKILRLFGNLGSAHLLWILGNSKEIVNYTLVLPMACAPVLQTCSRL